MAKTETIIPEKIFFKIGEVCELVGVQAHVLRYWETEFPMLSPKKNKSGQRTYRRKDVEIALRIKDLLYEDLFTIAGAKKRLQAENRGGGKEKFAEMDSVSLSPGDQPSLIDEEILEVEAKTGKAKNGAEMGDLELDDDRREALKSLVSQLLDLREMLKSNGVRDSDRNLNRKSI